MGRVLDELWVWIGWGGWLKVDRESIGAEKTGLAGWGRLRDVASSRSVSCLRPEGAGTGRKRAAGPEVRGGEALSCDQQCAVPCDPESIQERQREVASFLKQHGFSSINGRAAKCC